MKDIATWLENLGLGKYIDAFVENEIDLAVLPDLTEQDLNDLALPIGPRRKLLKAIKALASDDTRSTVTEPGSAAPQAERRQLTVMFVDLVGSTALSGRFDPEDLGVIMRRFQNTVSGEINRLEGYVAKFMGDGVLAYFGWPRAHEDEAERAVRAGLAIVSEVSRLKTPDEEPLAARIGIATGQVVVGDLIGKGSAQEETVVGETPNIAARLEALAGSGEVMISESTRQLCGEIFDLEPLGGQLLKGVAEAVEVFRVGGERAQESRFQSQHAGAVLPLAGRETELAWLLERWQRAGRGEGNMVLLSGEAGIGKSRLLRAVYDTLKGEPHYRISYQCSPYHTDSALYPVIQQLHRAVSFTADDDNEAKLDKLEALLGLALPEPRKSATFFATLLDINGESRFGKLQFEPQQQRAQTLQALIAQLAGLAERQPVLFVLEDAHWSDPTTLELIELSLDAVKAARILLLLTARPTFEHRFGGHPIVTRLVLNRLGQEPSTAIIHRLSASKPLPAELVDEIIRKTDGVPLFVEELTKSVLESGVLREIDTAYELASPISQLAIPATLHDSLMARLDRLQAVKEIAQIAACIGRQFDYSLIERIAPLTGASLQHALTQLTAAELIFQRGTVSNVSYIFKHALVRDAAYESLLKSRRLAIHAKLVDVLEASGSAVPELVAYHATEAGLHKKAVELWRKAGTAAMLLPAYDEAIAHLKTAMKLIPRMAEREDWRERELEILVQLAQVLVAKFGPGTESTEVFERAAANIDATENMELRVAIYYGKWSGHYVRAEHRSGLEVAAKIVDEVNRQDTAVPRLIAHRLRAATLIALGRPAAALHDLELAFALYQDKTSQDFTNRFPQEPGIQLMCYQLLALWMTGYADQALTLATEMTNKARRLSHPYTTCYAGLHYAMLALLCRDDELLEPVVGEVTAIAHEYDIWLWHAMSSMIDSLVGIRKGDKAAWPRLSEAFDSFRATGWRLWISFFLAEQANVLLDLGETSQANDTVRQALELVDQTDERWVEAELYRIQGEIHLAKADRVRAEDSFIKAIEIARQQGARLMELRAATSLARHWTGQGQKRKARDLLRPVHDWFTEGFDTTDLKDARALLDELA